MGILFLIYISLLISILIHEVGHLLAICWVGHKLNEFSVGPFSIKWSTTGYSIKPRFSLFTGLVGYDRIIRKTSWRNEALIIVSGTLGNFIVGGGFLLYYHLYSSNGLIAIIGWTSILLGFLNFFPSKINLSDLESDMHRLISMISFRNNIAKIKTYEIEHKFEKVSLKFSSELKSEKAQIEFFNDDVTPMNFVVSVINSYFTLDVFSAAITMLSIHNQGTAKLGWMELNIAREICDSINMEAQAHGYPFRCKVSLTD
jgi:ATP-dependent Clp protease adaptor protein ClpS